jgi:hypothetical protein
MRVRRLINGDFSFGQGLANYARDGEAVRQNVVTRIKSFINDWFLNMGAHIDWYALLSNKNTRDQIIANVRSVAETTEGVRSVGKIVLEEPAPRRARLRFSITTLYDATYDIDMEVTDERA